MNTPESSAPDGPDISAPEGLEILPGPAEPMALARVLEKELRVNGSLTVRHWSGTWMRHDGPRWLEYGEQDIRGWLYTRLEDAWYAKKDELERWNPTHAKLNVVLHALADAISLVPTGIAVPAWLGDHAPAPASEIIAVANGLLVTSTRKLLPHTPDYFNQIAVPFAYDPAAPEPVRWLRFLDELWPEDPDAILALQELFGYVLSGRNDQHKIGLLIGPKRSGKGTIARVLAALIGQENVAGPTLAQLGSNFGLWPLIGKTLAVISDARLSGTSYDISHLLAISGGDRITIDRKYQEPWTGTLSARFLILSNEPPAFHDPSGAIISRFLVITTTESFFGRENPHLTEELLDELPGILGWSFAGLDRLAHAGAFTQPQSSADLIAGMHDVASPARVFAEERCILDPAATIAVADLYAAWAAWCRETGNRPGSTQTFSRDLRTVHRELKIIRPRVGGHQGPRCWLGIRLRTLGKQWLILWIMRIRGPLSASWRGGTPCHRVTTRPVCTGDSAARISAPMWIMPFPCHQASAGRGARLGALTGINGAGRSRPAGCPRSAPGSRHGRSCRPRPGTRPRAGPGRVMHRGGGSAAGGAAPSS